MATDRIRSFNQEEYNALFLETEKDSKWIKTGREILENLISGNPVVGYDTRYPKDQSSMDIDRDRSGLKGAMQKCIAEKCPDKKIHTTTMFIDQTEGQTDGDNGSWWILFSFSTFKRRKNR